MDTRNKKPLPPGDETQTDKPSVKLLINIDPDPELKNYSKIGFKILSDKEVPYALVINTLISLIDDLITKQTQANAENSLQLEESQTSSAKIS